MGVKGTGKTGKRLWLRTHDNRWIEVPYGGSQDSNIKNLNIYDGQNWLCPTWGRLLWTDFFTDPGLLTDFDSLQVHAPGVTWTDHKNNPTYRTHKIADTRQWTTGEEANWIRLFYLAPRTDPTWRIVPLHYPTPSRTPNITLDYEGGDYFSFLSFWPAVTFRTVYFFDGVLQQFLARSTVDLTYWQPGGVSEIVQYTLDQYTDAAKQYEYRQLTYNTAVGTQVGCIDLKSIRRKLGQTYRYQDITFTGQKNDIDNQQLRRVYVKLTIQVQLTFDGMITRTTGREFDATVFQMRYYCGAVTEQLGLVNPSNNVGAVVNIPRSADPAGLVLWSCTGAQLDVNASTSYPQDAVTWTDRDTGAKYGNWELRKSFEITQVIEDPGEDNITLYGEILNPTGINDNLPKFSGAMEVFVDRICLQYADAHKDVPTDKMRWDALP